MIKKISKKNRFELFEHLADMGVRGFGADPQRAFEQAGLALSSVCCDLDKVSSNQKVEISCEAPNIQVLFVDWLNCLIYESSTRKMIFSKFEIHQFDNKSLKATISGEEVNVQKHHPAVEVKGATFTQLKVEELPNGLWLAQTVVDV